MCYSFDLVIEIFLWMWFFWIVDDEYVLVVVVYYIVVDGWLVVLLMVDLSVVYVSCCVGWVLDWVLLLV